MERRFGRNDAFTIMGDDIGSREKIAKAVNRWGCRWGKCSFFLSDGCPGKQIRHTSIFGVFFFFFLSFSLCILCVASTKTFKSSKALMFSYRLCFSFQFHVLPGTKTFKSLKTLIAFKHSKICFWCSLNVVFLYNWNFFENCSPDKFFFPPEKWKKRPPK